MINIIISTHGGLAMGIIDSSKMVYGEQENVVAIPFEREDDAPKLRKKLEAQIKKFKNDQQTLIMVDLLGGTPYNQASQIAADDKYQGKVAVISGINLPMLLETFGNRMGKITDASQLAEMAVQPGIEGITIFPEAKVTKTTKAAKAQSDSSSSTPVASAKVAGGKGLDLRLVRIDSRLLHGQVATTWTRESSPKRILIVSDNVSKDDLRKTLLTQAAPVGVKVNVIPIQKLIDIYDDKRFEGIPTMLLFDSTDDIRRVVDAGVKIETLNIGSMAHDPGKTMIDSANAVDGNDVANFQYLDSKGVKFDVRKVPTDKAANLFDEIKKAGVTASAGEK